MIAFIKKELLEQVRSGKMLFMAILFVLFGVMNPAIAKLTPWLLEVMADSLAESGMTVTVQNVSAMDSWVQFFKNIPIALIAFVLLQGGIVTKEYSSGTLILSLTKGLKRRNVLCVKAFVLYGLWTAGYWLCFYVTYLYNAYFWDNSVVQSLAFSSASWWLFGLWVLSMAVLFSTVSSSSTSVFLGCGGAVIVSYMLALIPKIEEYLPTMLTSSNALIYGALKPEDYLIAFLITAILSVASFVISIPVFNKKQL